jgi:hypothetical protein
LAAARDYVFATKAGKDITISKAPKWTIPMVMREMVVGDK